ncbi:SDR family NAD(P)-dependent oxidoreductase [Natrinema salaciae]|uniref:NAD(P)-dependent dehydrogenase, short-chain alcohol dehydrogenase family n=1 Tax=Natrinema salaciae TaxID=1186196 RepID=A0A1H9I714_9EURY|nr:SDR family oxidoreductase [Natrinema salaciae]SEQ70195.1 NAD(P)-dependent dehydrogenase, short-chain alcohol dehydrogenase family [Natrinema salaciae]
MVADSTVFVTGASQGLGREIAVAFADEGANVALAARSDGIYETAELIDAPDRTLAVETDVTDSESVADAIAATVDAFGGLDCLVNNAGIAGPTAPIEETTDDEWLETLDVNVVGVARVTREAAPHLRSSERGSVINISSIGGKRPYANRTPYAASKMGLIGMTRALAAEFGDDDVPVNAICPGPVEGDRIRGVFERQAEEAGVPVEAVEGEVLESLMIDELVPPEEVAELAVHLASADSRHVTGQDINVSSGGAWY